MASCLRPNREALGVGPEAHLVDKKLFDPQGRMRGYEELSEEIGGMQAFLALLEFELRQRCREPRARGYPPRIFISYRRESPSDIAWCRQLGGELEALGYDVLLDEILLGNFAGDFAALARFMGLMADADVAVFVVTDGFLYHEGKPNTMRDWIFEEWSRIETLSTWGVLETVVAHRGGELPGSMFGGVGVRAEYIDLREDPANPKPVADFFGRWSGTAISPEQRQRLARGAATAVGCFGEYPDPNRALEALASIADLTGTEEYAVAAAYTAAACGEAQRAASLAIETVNRNPGICSGFLLGKLLWLLDCNRLAYGVLAPLAEGPSLWRHQMRHMMAWILQDLGLAPSARNQYRWCLQAQGSHELGGFWSSMGATAVQMCETGLAATSAGVELGEVSRCEHCEAEFPRGWGVCVHCGVTKPGGEPCEVCFGDPPLMENPQTIEFCPVCRKMTAGGEKPGNAYIVPREPKGAWSPLAWR